MNKPVPQLTPRALKKLQCHFWPGNIRDLRNFIERLMVFHIGNAPIEEHEIKFPANEQPFQFPAHLLDQPYEDAKGTLLHEFKLVYFKRAIQKHGGNKTAIAKALGLDRTSLHRILQELGL